MSVNYYRFRCKTQRYLADLPAASIVIPFYNEHWSTLMRSVHSIIKRSPLELVKEIILVDDASEKNHLKEKLEEYIQKMNANGWENKVRVVRLKARDGLIGARLAGAKNASAEVLIFLDCHIEVNKSSFFIMKVKISSALNLTKVFIIVHYLTIIVLLTLFRLMSTGFLLFLNP